MKYKVLLIGTDSDIINSFFENGNDIFELFTSSPIFANLNNAVKYFQPDAILYCMQNEMPEYINAVSLFMHQTQIITIPLIIMGNQSDYNLFTTLTRDTPDLFISKDSTFSTIAGNLSNFLNKSNNHTGNDKPQWGDALMLTDNSQNDGRKRILVIDDSPIMLKTIASSLRTNYNVATAVSGRIGIRYLQSKSVDLILLDYEMPDENGAIVMEKIKNNPKTSSIPIIFLTGVQDTAKVQNALSLKPEGYLLKPVNTDALMTKIRQILH